MPVVYRVSDANTAKFEQSKPYILGDSCLTNLEKLSNLALMVALEVV